MIGTLTISGLVELSYSLFTNERTQKSCFQGLTLMRWKRVYKCIP